MIARHPDTTCLGCGSPLNAALQVATTDLDVDTTDAVTVCMPCGLVQWFDPPTGRLRRPTADEARLLELDDGVQLAVAAARRARDARTASLGRLN